MTPEEELAEVMAEARELDRAVIEAFGLDPANVIEGHMRIEGLGLRVDLVKGPPVEFPAKDWTPAQEDAVKGLYKHFPQRYFTSMPDLSAIRKDWNL